MIKWRLGWGNWSSLIESWSLKSLIATPKVKILITMSAHFPGLTSYELLSQGSPAGGSWEESGVPQSYIILVCSDDSQKMVQMRHPNPGFVVWWEELLLTSHRVMGLWANYFHLPESAQAWTKKKGRGRKAGWAKPAEMLADTLWCFMVLERNFFLSPCSLSGSQEPHSVQVPLLSL